MSISFNLLPKLVIDTGDAPLLSDDNRVQVWSNAQGNNYAYGYKQQEICAISFPNLSIYTFTEAVDQVTIFPSPKASRERIDELYYKFVLQYALQVRGFEVLHSSAIETPKGVVAFCGASESGKSSLAFALSKRGYFAWADDAVIFKLVEDKISVFSLPFCIKLRPEPANFFMEKNGLLKNRTSDKVEAVNSLLALFILRRSEKEPVNVAAIEPKEVFSSILPYAHSFDLNNIVRKEEMIKNYLELSSQIPVFDLSFRTGLENLFPTVDKIEQIIQALL
jgi:hypothetical protein